MIYCGVEKGKWNLSLGTDGVRLKIEKGWCARKDLDEKWGRFKLDGMEIYANWKQNHSLFTFPAKIQIYSDHDIREFSIVLDKDFMIYRSNEVPDFIWNDIDGFFVCCLLEHEFQKVNPEDKWIIVQNKESA